MMTNNDKTYKLDTTKYLGTNNALFEHRLTPNGKIDFSAPPEGYRYTATPINWEIVESWNLDPMFVKMHYFGTWRTLCYMELTKASDSTIIEQPYKKENRRETCLKRCRIISPKTGKLIMCPYDGNHYCGSCMIPDNKKAAPMAPLSLDALMYPDEDTPQTFDIPDPFILKADYEERDERLQIRKELHDLDAYKETKGQQAMHLQIYNLWVAGYSFTEISEYLEIKKATLHDDLVRIAKIVKKYIDE